MASRAHLRVGIVGCGRMGRERARCADASGARVAAVYDDDGARAQELAARYGARVSANARDLADCDAVFLCTPPDVRPAMAGWAAATGMPFLAEKPVAVNGVDAEPVLHALAARAASHAPLVHAVGYMNRWRSSVRHARGVLQGHRVLGMTAHWVNRAYGVPWWLDQRSSGGPHNEQATHLYDLARYLCGEIEDAGALHGRAAGGQRAATGVAAVLRFASGALGTILYSCEASAKDIGLRVFTPEGSVAFAGWDFVLVENTIDRTSTPAGAEDVFLVETGAFLEAVREGTPDAVACDWADALRTQRAVDATYGMRYEALHDAAPAARREDVAIGR